MAFVLSEEHGLLQKTAAQFFEEQMPVAHLRDLRDSKNETRFDKKLWKTMSELGFTGMLVPEEHGGTDFGTLGMGLVFEESGRRLSPSPLFGTACIAATALHHAGSDAQKKEHLPKIADGTRIFAPAFEEGAHHAPYAVSCKAEKTKEGFRLTGRKRFAPDGAAADYLILSARTSGAADDKKGITLFLVPTDAKGVNAEPLSMADSRHLADIQLEGVEVGSASLLGSVDGGGDLLSNILDVGRIALAAEMLGGAREVFDRTLAHLKERKQFDQIIGSFQALKHRAAKLFCEIEMGHSIVRDALDALEARRNDVPQMASLAKAYMADLTRHMTNEGVQLHGGMGMTDEVDMGLFMKRARVQAQLFGDSNYHRKRYARLNGF